MPVFVSRAVLICPGSALWHIDREDPRHWLAGSPPYSLLTTLLVVIARTLKLSRGGVSSTDPVLLA